MKRSRPGSPIDDLKTSFFGLCLTAGQQVFQPMMEQHREQLCGLKNVPDPDRRAIRGGSAPSEVGLGGRRIAMPRLRARSTDGKAIPLPTFRYARAGDPLDAYTLEQNAIGVATRKYRRTLDPLPNGVAERAISKSAVSRRFVALTSRKLTTWLAAPLDGLNIRVLFIYGFHIDGGTRLHAPGSGRVALRRPRRDADPATARRLGGALPHAAHDECHRELERPRRALHPERPPLAR